MNIPINSDIFSIQKCFFFRKSTTFPKFQRKNQVYKEQSFLVNTTTSVQNPTMSFKTFVKRHVDAGSSAYSGWLKWKAYKKRRSRYRILCHRHGPRPHKFCDRPTRDLFKNLQHQERPKKVFIQDDGYSRRGVKKQYHQHQKPQKIRIQSVPTKHAVRFVDQPRSVTKQKIVVKVGKPWQKFIPWVTARPGKIPDAFNLEEPLPELGGSPPSFPAKQIFSNNEYIDKNVPFKYDSSKHPISISNSVSYNSYPLDPNSLEDGTFLNNYLKQNVESPAEYVTSDLPESDVISYNTYSPVAENMRDYNWYDYNKYTYSFTTQSPLVNSITEYKQYETIPITEYYQQNYNTLQPVPVLKEPSTNIEDSVSAYTNAVSVAEENLNQYEYMPITEYKQRNHSQLSELVFKKPTNITKPVTLNLKIISAHELDEILKNKDKEIVKNIFPPFKQESEHDSRFSSKRNITKYFKPFPKINSLNKINSEVFNGHTYNITYQKELPKVVNISSEDLSENFVTIIPYKTRREYDVLDKVYDATNRDTDLRINQDAMNQENPLQRRIIKKEIVRKTDEDIQEAVLTNIMFVADNI